MPYSNNFVAAAIEKTIRRNLAYTLTQDETQLLAKMSVAALQKSFLQEADRNVILRDHLTYVHHNKDWVFLSTTPFQAGRKEVKVAQYWYRGMDDDEFRILKRTNEVAQNDSFGGICTNRNYAAQYLTNNNGKLIVEWSIPPAGRLYELMTAAGINIKDEGDGGTYGLGDKGTQDHRPGSHQKVTARDIFLEYCGGKFRVVDLKVPNTLDAVKRT